MFCSSWGGSRKKLTLQGLETLEEFKEKNQG
jgi:hypothetical protein